MTSRKSFINELQASWNIIRLSEIQINDLQEFVHNFNEFFLLCEGEIGSAEGLLKACPPSKNIRKDKFILGVYDGKKLKGVIDLIRDYPADGIWTIGYFLIHPASRGNHMGYNFIKDVEKSLIHQSAVKLRCGVQEQNINALRFWLKCDFEIVDKILETLGKSKHLTYILEKSL